MYHLGLVFYNCLPLDDLPIAVSEVFGSYTIIVFLSVSSFRSFSNCYRHFGTLKLSVYMLVSVTSS